MRLITRAIAMLVGLVVLASCERDDDGDGAASHCLAVPPGLVEAIAAGLDPGLSLRHARAVKSEDIEEVYLVAADLEGSGHEGDDDIAVWATTALEPGAGVIVAVDALAQEISNWPDGDQTDIGGGSTADAAREATICARAAVGD